MTPWDLYFATIVGWQCHPGYLKSPGQKMDLHQCAELADAMCQTREISCETLTNKAVGSALQ